MLIDLPDDLYPDFSSVRAADANDGGAPPSSCAMQEAVASKHSQAAAAQRQTVGSGIRPDAGGQRGGYGSAGITSLRPGGNQPQNGSAAAAAAVRKPVLRPHAIPIRKPGEASKPAESNNAGSTSSSASSPPTPAVKPPVPATAGRAAAAAADARQQQQGVPIGTTSSAAAPSASAAEPRMPAGPGPSVRSGTGHPTARGPGPSAAASSAHPAQQGMHHAVPPGIHRGWPSPASYTGAPARPAAGTGTAAGSQLGQQQQQQRPGAPPCGLPQPPPPPRAAGHVPGQTLRGRGDGLGLGDTSIRGAPEQPPPPAAAGRPRLGAPMQVRPGAAPPPPPQGPPGRTPLAQAGGWGPPAPLQLPRASSGGLAGLASPPGPPSTGSTPTGLRIALGSRQAAAAGGGAVYGPQDVRGLAAGAAGARGGPRSPAGDLRSPPAVPSYHNTPKGAAPSAMGAPWHPAGVGPPPGAAQGRGVAAGYVGAGGTSSHSSISSQDVRTEAALHRTGSSASSGSGSSSSTHQGQASVVRAVTTTRPPPPTVGGPLPLGVPPAPARQPLALQACRASGEGLHAPVASYGGAAAQVQANGVSPGWAPGVVAAGPRAGGGMAPQQMGYGAAPAGGAGGPQPPVPQGRGAAAGALGAPGKEGGQGSQDVRVQDGRGRPGAVNGRATAVAVAAPGLPGPPGRLAHPAAGGYSMQQVHGAGEALGGPEPTKVKSPPANSSLQQHLRKLAQQAQGPAPPAPGTPRAQPRKGQAAAAQKAGGWPCATHQSDTGANVAADASSKAKGAAVRSKVVMMSSEEATRRLLRCGDGAPVWMYLQPSGVQMGPYGGAKLHELLCSGTINHSTQVCGFTRAPPPGARLMPAFFQPLQALVETVQAGGRYDAVVPGPGRV